MALFFSGRLFFWKCIPWRRSLLAFVWTLLPWAIFANCSVSCIPTFNHSIGTEGFYIISPSDLLSDPDCDPLDFHVIVFDEGGVPSGDTIDCRHEGQSITAQLFETASGNSCITQIDVFDLLPPTIMGGDTLIDCGLPTEPDILGYPGVLDNCTSLDTSDLDYDDVITNYNCLEIVNGDTLNALIQRTWTTTDDAGNQGQFIQLIKIRKTTV
ncbi:MAG: hypothetical protein HKN16_08775, partial [Saprospiraceae bacterium]|nr:hypothetical protein [Saprospiraceae bacterium]